MIESSDALAKALARKLLKRPHSSTQARLKPYSPNLPRRRKLAFYNNNRSSKATLEYLINVYDQLSVYGGNQELDTHCVLTYLKSVHSMFVLCRVMLQGPT